MRLFVAVDLPEPLREDLERRVVARLRPSVPDARWTRPEGRHLTLKFLGEVPDDRVPDVCAALEPAVAGDGPFDAALGEVGGFPNLRRPRVLWVGTSAGRDELARLAGRVESALEPLGFAREDRPFRAHLTLARFKAAAPVGELPDVDVPTEPFRVDEAVLFRSELRRDGARYTPVRRFAL